jgi:hypothetical protein
MTQFTPEIGHSDRAPGWTEFILKGTAIVGILWISVFLLRTWWLTTENGQLPVDLRDISLCAVAWLVSVIVLWRQFRLQKWACTLATLIAWGTVPTLWLMRAPVQQVPYAATLLLVAGSAFIALLITSACITGWKELREGF